MVVKTSVKIEGFEGILFQGNGSKEKAVIVITGSNGGMKLTRKCAEFYNRHGVPALPLALFGTKGTQSFLDRVPVEYVEHAIKWLREKGYKKIGVDGMSKGSELALIAASMFSELSCVIVRVPSHFVSEGIIGRRTAKKPSGTSCWSYHGKELPFTPYKSRKFDVLKTLKEHKEIHSISFNRDKEVMPASLIQVENIKAPILMLSSKNDTVWPSYESAKYMDEKLTEIGFPYKHKHVAYEDMSHALMTEMPFVYRFAFKAERNNRQGCNQDRKRLKKDLLEWVEKTW